MSLDVRLKRADRVYHPGETVAGVVVVSSKGPLAHNGITLAVDGTVVLQSSPRNVGLFEAFYNSLKPITLLALQLEVARPGRLPDGTTEIPFEFPLQPLAGAALYETYHGVFVNISYNLKCDMPRSLLAKNLSKSLEFIVEVLQPPASPLAAGAAGGPEAGSRVPFMLTPESLEHVRRGAKAAVPRFRIEGFLSSAQCQISQPFTGQLVVEESDAVIKSIELQLVRVETCGSAEGYAKEATEIQNIQVADGDVCRKLPLPLHMIFPRLFTCPSLATRTFKLEFEVNLVVALADGHVITENFPIKLVRTQLAD